MPKVTKETVEFNEGWVIHVYGRDRRLLCSLEPSHCWMFVAGLALGALLMATWVRGEPSSAQPEMSPIEVPAPAPLAVD